MRNNLILITSIIHTPKLPSSYTNTRSVFTPEDRFEQTKKTIQSVKEKIPNCKILMVECSNLSDEQYNYFISNCDYFLNLINDKQSVNNIYSISKSLGEGTMTIAAIKYIKKNNILFDNFFKISGRYWLSNKFNYSNFDNDSIVIHYINGDVKNCATYLYKLYNKNIDDYMFFLISNHNQMVNCIGYEVLFANFLKVLQCVKIINLNTIGINGLISVSNHFIDT